MASFHSHYVFHKIWATNSYICNRGFLAGSRSVSDAILCSGCQLFLHRQQPWGSRDDWISCNCRYATHHLIGKSIFNSQKGLYYVILAVVTFIYLICSIRTNVCFFLALLFLTIAYNLYAAVHFYAALGNKLLAARIEVVGDQELAVSISWYWKQFANFFVSKGCGCMQFHTLLPNMVHLCSPDVGVDWFPPCVASWRFERGCSRTESKGAEKDGEWSIGYLQYSSPFQLLSG